MTEKQAEYGRKHLNLFGTLNAIDVMPYVEQKGQFDYLPWATAWKLVKDVDPTASFLVHTFKVTKTLESGTVVEQEVPYLRTSTGYYVKVTVSIHGQLESELLPVLNYRNQPIDSPNAMDVNKAIKRCMVKAIALHGLGLSLWYGEDLPDDNGSTVKKLTDNKAAELKKRMAKNGEVTTIDNPNVANYTKDKILKWIDERAVEAIGEKAFKGLVGELVGDGNLKSKRKDQLVFLVETLLTRYPNLFKSDGA
tara:strand:- start:1015 stop:1767 length:753 start_codon:yes stop_codon:yes gene_type:complete